jgi:hypothetical protein
MLPIAQYDKTSIISDELMDELFNEPDEIERSRMIAELSLRAKELKISTIFSNRIKACARAEKEVQRRDRRQMGRQCYVTDFSIPVGKSYQNMKCGSWVANENGVVSYSVIGMEQRACYHPILPVRRLSNVETNEEKITIAYKRDHRWKEHTFDKEVISSANKITSLSKYGIAVTSETAKHLVKYLADVEYMNMDDIELGYSTSKLGWHGTDFIPYDSGIEFDGDVDFRQLFEAIQPRGDADVWLDHVRKLRKTNRIEIKFMLAASFASVLVKPLGCLPFIVDLWGETEGGKSVALMLAASIWADPGGSRYKSTEVSLEARADMLNNLPVLLDDTSNAKKNIADNFETIIYMLCSGKGKSRSNKQLGIERERNWRTCFITNGERPFSGYVTQGGAINRIIEVECGNNVFEDPAQTAELIKTHYGYAGRAFVEAVKSITTDDLHAQFNEICNQLYNSDKMQKQAMSVACVLLADKIATESIFKDGVYISLNEAKECLIDRTELSDNERCYSFLCDQVAMNSFRFEPDCQTEQWGIISDGYAVMYPTVVDKLLRSNNYSKKSFMSWAKKNGIVDTDEKGNLRVRKIRGKNVRAISIKLKDEIEVDENGFMPIDDQIELPFDQEELPFD